MEIVGSSVYVIDCKRIDVHKLLLGERVVFRWDEHDGGGVGLPAESRRSSDGSDEKSQTGSGGRHDEVAQTRRLQQRLRLRR